MAGFDTSDFDFNFDSLQITEIPVNYLGKKYILREASGDAAAQYQDKLLSLTEFDGTGTKVKKMPGINKLDVLIVSLCLCETDTEGKVLMKSEDGILSPVTVSEKLVASWPSRITKPLAKAAREISGIGLSKLSTIEEIDREIARLQRARTELMTTDMGEEGEPEPLGKGLPADTTTGSA